MALQVMEKQPWEERILAFDFSADMDSGETVSAVDSISVTAVSPGVDSLTISGQTGSGGLASAKFAGGVTGQVYTLRARITTSAGQKLEMDGKLKVKEL